MSEYGPNPPTGIKRWFLLLMLGLVPNYQWLNQISTVGGLVIVGSALAGIGYLWGSA
jgi:hypothetical protein